MVRQDSFQSIVSSRVVTKRSERLRSVEPAREYHSTLRQHLLQVASRWCHEPAAGRDNAREIHAGLTLGTGLDRIRVKGVHSMYDYRMLSGMSLPETDCVPRPFV
jgi:hypothetical protein